MLPSRAEPGFAEIVYATLAFPVPLFALVTAIHAVDATVHGQSVADVVSAIVPLEDAALALIDVGDTA